MTRFDLDPYVVPGLGDSAKVGAIIHPRTAAERAAGANPANFSHSEGDIRRYGASVDASDNAAAIMTALMVSGHGGSAAWIPAGSWHCAQPVIVAPLSSLHGSGNASVLAFRGCDGLVFAAGETSYSKAGLSRFIRDFQVFSLDEGPPDHSAIRVDHPASRPTAVIGVEFRNININGFLHGVYARGLWYSVLHGVATYRCPFGFYFIGQNIANTLVACYASGQDLSRISATAGITIDTTAGESTQALKILGCETYYFDIGIHAPLSYDLKIEACNLAACQSTGISLTSTIEGCVIRDCWIDLNSLSGPKRVAGIWIADVQPERYSKNLIEGNTIKNEQACAGSVCISVGNANHGIVINSNNILYFDHGVRVGNSRATIKWNSISCVTSAVNASTCAIRLDSSAADCDVGPNDIRPGPLVAASAARGTANLRMADAARFPVGVSVSFATSVHGFQSEVVYYVVACDPPFVRLGAHPAGDAIAATDDVAVELCVQPEPITFTAPMVPPGLCLSARGCSLLTLSDPPVSGLARWTANGRQVSLNLTSNVIGPAGNSSMRVSGVPSFLFPRATQGVACLIENESLAAGGYAVLSAGFSFEVFTGPLATPWSTRGTKGLLGATMTWTYY